MEIAKTSKFSLTECFVIICKGKIQPEYELLSSGKPRNSQLQLPHCLGVTGGRKLLFWVTAKAFQSKSNLKFILEINWHKLFIPPQGGNYTQAKTIAYKGSCLLCSVPSLNSCNLFSVVQFGLRPFQYTIQQRWGFSILKKSVCISNAEWIHYCVHFFQFPHLPLTPDAPRVFLPSQKQIVTWHSFSGFGFSSCWDVRENMCSEQRGFRTSCNREICMDFPDTVPKHILDLHSCFRFTKLCGIRWHDWFQFAISSNNWISTLSN